MLFLGNRIDCEIAATQIVFKRDIGAGVEGKALIAAPGLALGTRQRVLFSCLRIEEDREILADRLVAECLHLFRRDRKSVVYGKSGSVRVDLVGRRIIIKKKIVI